MVHVGTPSVVAAPCGSVLLRQLLWFLCLFLRILTLVLFAGLWLLQELLKDEPTRSH